MDIYYLLIIIVAISTIVTIVSWATPQEVFLEDARVVATGTLIVGVIGVLVASYFGGGGSRLEPSLEALLDGSVLFVVVLLFSAIVGIIITLVMNAASSGDRRF